MLDVGIPKTKPTPKSPPPGTRGNPDFLHQKELADRWRISPRSLERHRQEGSGPPFHRIGGRIRYHRRDIEKYEAENRFEPKPRDKPRKKRQRGSKG